MASNRAMTPSRRPRSSRWLGLALAVLLGAGAGAVAPHAAAQDGARSRAQEILKSAVDTYKRGDFESAATQFTQAQQRRDDLDSNDRLDLDTFAIQNKNALQARRDGAAQLRHAEEALNQGRTADAAKFIKSATVNQYLSPGDRQMLRNLSARMQSGTTAAALPNMNAMKGDPKAMLSAARAAYQQGDLNAAEALANEAERAGAGSSWLQPWADTPTKVRRDVQNARAKLPPPMIVKGPAEMPQKRFTKETAPPPLAPSPVAQPVSGSPYAQAPSAPVPSLPSIPSLPPAPVAQSPTPPAVSMPKPFVPPTKTSVAAAPPVQGPSLTSGPNLTPPPALPSQVTQTAASLPSVPPPVTPIPTTPTPAPVTPIPTTPSPFSPTVPAAAQVPAPVAGPSTPSPFSPTVQVGAQMPAPVIGPTTIPTPDMPPPPATAQKVAPLPVPPKSATPSTPDPKVVARQLIADGYKALGTGDLETARLMAYRVRDMRVKLDAGERNHEQLLHDIDQRAAAVASAKAPKTPAAAKAPVTPPADPRVLVKEGKALLQQHKLDEAEMKCNQAAAVKNARWGLFEYSPDQLRSEIQKARAVHNREESDRLLADARKQFSQGHYEDAKKKAWRAQELHGPYSPWDFGDRPQKLLTEITKAETTRAAEARKTEQKPAPVLPASKQEPKAAAAVASKSPDAAITRAKALSLIAEARDLERRGQLTAAHAKVLEARKLGVVFAPGEDSPDAVLLSLSAKSRSHIQVTLRQVTETVGAKPGDVTCLQQAQFELANARQLALAFGLDTADVDQKAAWVQQAAVRAGPAAIVNVPPPAAPTPLTKMEYQTASASPANNEKHKEGLDKLERARLELRHGSYTVARRLAEDAFDAVYGVQKEAEVVLRDIDAEEHNQRLLAAQRTFDAGVDAFVHGDYKRASSILGNVDLVLLSPQHQQRLREIMSTREMQPQGIAQAGSKVVLTQGTTGQAPGTAVAGDQSEDPLANVKAMEHIQFQQMAQRNVQAQKSAMELFRAGDKMKAVDLLTGQIAQVDALSFSPEASRNLKAPLERRLSEFRTMMANELLNNQRKDNKALAWDEGKYQEKVRKQQDQVSDLIKQCNALSKEGKYKEGLALAYRVKELDPDNVAATAYVTMLNIQINQQKSDEVKAAMEGNFIDALRPDVKRLPTEDTPFTMDPSAIKRHADRKSAPQSIFEQRRNPKEKAIEYRLEQPIHFGFRDTPLRDVIDALSKMSNVPIYEDQQALQQSSISLDHALTMESNGLSMKSALNILLGKMSLTYVIRDEALMITTVDKAKSNFKRAVYPVGDLIVPVEDAGAPDVFNLQKVLEKHWNAQYAMMNYYGASPVTNQPMGLPPGQPVSSFNTGLGGAFGATSQSQAPSSQGYNPVQKRAPRQTMEDLLIDLIKGTIAPHTWKDMGGPGTIQYYPLGMALVVNQAQEVQEDVEALLRALRRLQDMEIAIEMRLVLVAESFYERIGVDFDVNLRTPVSGGVQNQLLNNSFQPFGTVNRNLGFNNVVTGLTPAGTLTPDLNFPIKNSSFNFSVPPFGGYTAPGLDGGLSLGLAFLSEIQVFMILEAAQADSRTNIMMAPKITVFNGQTAFITVSVSQFLNLGITAFPINGQIIFNPTNVAVPTGTTLTVTPVVSADRRFVRMNLAPTITNFINGNTIGQNQVQIPIPNVVDGPLGIGVQTGQPAIFNTFQIQVPTGLAISTITMNTTVNVPDGGTVLLGGLKIMSEGRNEAGPPVLSKIPYLDRLFRNVGWGRDSQSLMIMVTPRIIINEEEEAIFMQQIPPIPRP